MTEQKLGVGKDMEPDTFRELYISNLVWLECRAKENVEEDGAGQLGKTTLWRHIYHTKYLFFI